MLMAAFAALAADRPNILFIMADDHTTQAFGSYGSRLAKLNPTPVLDRLAAEGIRFDRVFCNNSICTPSRASIMTGQYSQTNGVLDLGGRLEPENQHLAREMRKAGYHTAMIGKWHLKAEPAAFDYYQVLPGQGTYYDPEFRVRGDDAWPCNVVTHKEKHSSDAITDITLEWLREGWDREKPFFMMHHFKAPHDMFENAARYDSYLEDVEIPEPENLYGQPAEGAGSAATRGLWDSLVDRIGAGVTKRCNTWRLGQKLGIDGSLVDPEFAQQTYQRYLKRYLRCVKGVDDNVGRLIEYLRQDGTLDNTVILYTGDQGFFLGEHDLMDKRWMYEESFRMPLLMRYPKLVEASSTNDWLINNTDFAPTMLELAGVRTPEYMQGRSFVGALRGDQQPVDWRTTVYYRYWMHMAHELGTPAHFGVRSERYKLIFFYGTDYVRPYGCNRAFVDTPAGWEFYDLLSDPSEMSNEYGNPRYSAVIAGLKDELRRQREALDETDEAYPRIQRIIDSNWE
jgi:N-acetylglucosamine-6-sulfatase